MRSNPQVKTNLFSFQYVFPCHFAEVYSANALKFPIKDQSLPFPIRLPFQYVFLCHFAEVYSANALKSPN
jgi:hypothetical protein